ncbi:MAG: hypothetical protein ACLFUS_02625 [Candidatus Sumerlaeia bacterium]
MPSLKAAISGIFEDWCAKRGKIAARPAQILRGKIAYLAMSLKSRIAQVNLEPQSPINNIRDIRTIRG